jgi:hypothetical protein
MVPGQHSKHSQRGQNVIWSQLSNPEPTSQWASLYCVATAHNLSGRLASNAAQKLVQFQQDAFASYAATSGRTQSSLQTGAAHRDKGSDCHTPVHLWRLVCEPTA